jgi:hypothetical protein
MLSRGSRGAYIVAVVVAGALVAFFAVVPGLIVFLRAIAVITVIASAVVAIRYLHGDIEMFPDSSTLGDDGTSDDPGAAGAPIPCWRCGRLNSSTVRNCWSCGADLSTGPTG